jgi:hypothetical protein
LLRDTSEPSLADAAREIIAIPTIRGSFEHAALNFIGILRSFAAFRQAASPLTGAAAFGASLTGACREA